MAEQPQTFGEIRKKVEAKMNKEIHPASPEQVTRIRKLAPKVAEGTITYDAAIEEIRNLQEYDGKKK